MKIKTEVLASFGKITTQVVQKYRGTWNGKITQVDFIQDTVKVKGIGEDSNNWRWVPISRISPYLRTLDQMTTEEENQIALLLGYLDGIKTKTWDRDWFIEFWEEIGNAMFFNPCMCIPVLNYLRSIGIDTDGWIESDLAIKKED